MIEDRDAEFIATIRFYYQQELGRLPDPEGLASNLDFARHGGTGEEIQQNLHNSPEAIAYRAKPPTPLFPEVYLEIRGSDFVDTNGERTVLFGCDAFCAYRQFLDGVDLTPLFNETHEYGFNMWRVFMMGSVKQNNILQLSPSEQGSSYYEALPSFATLLNENGIVLLATVFVDAQDIMPRVEDQRNHWRAVADRLHGSMTLLSGGNQYPKNGWNPADLTDPGMLWSRGSSTADPDPFVPKPNGASFIEFHGRRDYPAMMLDTVASPVTLQTRDKLFVPLVMSEPIGHAEAAKPNSRNADPNISWRLARHFSTECGGAVFHNDAGMRGQLMGSVTRACAEAWQRGMRV